MKDYSDIAYKITGAAYLVGRKLGCGFLEKVYEKCLVYELEKKGLKCETQKEIRILYEGMDLGLQYYADIVVNDEVIIELKAVQALTDVHEAQLLHYLKASGMEFGVLINFGGKSVEFKRIANSKLNSHEPEQ